MDKLSIIKAIYENHFKLNGISRLNKFKLHEGVLGHGIGFSNPKAIRARKNESYSIVIIVADTFDINESKTKRSKFIIKKSDIPQLSNRNEVSNRLNVNVRYERKNIHSLEIQKKNNEPLAGSLSVNMKGGDPVYYQNAWIGTAGYAFQYQANPHVASNKHVFAMAGIGGSLNNNYGQTIAKVSVINSRHDSALAKLEPGIQFSKDIPGIGRPTSISGNIILNQQCRKRGAASGITEFVINFVGEIGGEAVARGSNKGNTAVVGTGDSGSIVLSTNNSIIGLVVKGSNIIGEGPGGYLFSEVYLIDILDAFDNISL